MTGRKRTDLGTDGDAIVRAGIARGQSAEQIAGALEASGISVSPRTIARRVREMRGAVRVSSLTPPVSRPTTPSADVDAPLPEDEDAIPDGASVTQLDHWIRQAQTAVDTAEAEGNLPLMGQMLRVAASLAETRRKATPPTPPDPNEHPDMVALGSQVAARLHKMVDLVAGKR